MAEPVEEAGGTNPPAPAPEELPEAGTPDVENLRKALAAERELRKTAEKSASEREARLKEFEDAGKSDAEKTAERLTTTERERDAATVKALKYEAAEKAGIPLAAAARLNGSTLDELVADAESLKALGVGVKKDVPPPPDPSQGQGGSGSPTTLKSAIAAHYGG